MAALVGSARDKGVSGYVGDANIWVDSTVMENTPRPWNRYRLSA